MSQDCPHGLDPRHGCLECVREARELAEAEPRVKASWESLDDMPEEMRTAVEAVGAALSGLSSNVVLDVLVNMLAHAAVDIGVGVQVLAALELAIKRQIENQADA